MNSVDSITDKSNISFLVGDYSVLEGMQGVPARQTFDEHMVGFLNELSRALLSNASYREYVDLMSYGFWIRKSHLMKEKPRYEGHIRMGKGVTFHIAPSNVPVNFAVSMTSALLAGNACVIRVSEKEFDQVRIITTEINKILQKEEYNDIKKYICVIRYPHNKEITDWLSLISDIRIIWGGDRTISEVRQSPLQPRGCEMTFADRHSIAVIDVNRYSGLSDDEKKQIAKDFYTDTYYSDQNACSSPRLVVWYNRSGSTCVTERHMDADDVNAGEEIPVIKLTEECMARIKFWELLKEEVGVRYELQPVVAVDKMEKFCELATDTQLIDEMWIRDGVNTPVQLIDNDPKCMRILVDELSDRLMDYKMLGGYFFEYETDDLTDITLVLGKRAQTIAYLGVDPMELAEVVCQAGVRGADRIVPIGHTMDLTFFWDGYDMIEEMSRRVDVVKL